MTINLVDQPYKKNKVSPYLGVDQQFKDIFRSLPKEKDEEITFDVCYDIIKKMNLDIEVPRQKFDKIMRIVDFNQNQLIDFMEFKRIILICSEIMGGCLDDLLIVYWAADANCDGEIQANEFQELLKKFSIIDKRVDFKEEIGDGLDFEGFKAMISKHWDIDEFTKLFEV